MKIRVFFLFFALVTSAGTIIADGTKIGDLYYVLYDWNMTAEVICQDYSVNNYNGLTSANIPSSVTYNSQTYSVTSISSGAFSFCSSLTSVTIPNSVTSIYGSAFNGCSSLISIIVETDNSIYDSRDNCNAIIKTSTNTLIVGCQNTIIPDNVTSIGNWAFADCVSLTSITIPNSVTNIEDDAFRNCTGLTSVTVPNSVISIGRSAFSRCSGLTSISIPNSVTSIGYSAFDNIPHIIYSGEATGSPWGARCVNGYIEGFLVYADDTKTDLRACFYEATGVVDIPNSVTSIGKCAFWGCSGLTSITIPNGVTRIEDGTFINCSSLTSISLPNDAWHIGSSVFANCTSLNSIDLPDGLFDIGDGAFENCSSLKSIVIPDGVIGIYLWTFKGCSSLTTINIPTDVRAIGTSVFVGCRSLTSVTWSAKSISNFTSVNTPFFYEKSSSQTFASYDLRGQIKTFEFGNEVETIPAYLCSGMNKLTSITIPNSTTEIGASAFSGCTMLQRITLGEGISTIGDSAIADSPYLIEVKAKMALPPIINISVFSGCGDLSCITCYVPKGSLAFYKKLDVWKEFNLVETSFDEETIETTNFTIAFNDNGGNELLSQEVVLRVPAAPEIEGFTFVGWKPVSSIIANNTLEIEAVYTANVQTSAPEVVNPANKSQKLIRNGNVYILTDTKTYTVQGQEVR